MAGQSSSRLLVRRGRFAGTSAVSASKAHCATHPDSCLSADRPKNPRQRCQPRRDRDAPFRQARSSRGQRPRTCPGLASTNPGEAVRQAPEEVAMEVAFLASDDASYIPRRPSQARDTTPRKAQQTPLFEPDSRRKSLPPSPVRSGLWRGAHRCTAAGAMRRGLWQSRRELLREWHG
jgi:hypothetical protein